MQLTGYGIRNGMELVLILQANNLHLLFAA